MKCPGQNRRDLKVGLYKCPHCGEIVEMFSDETHRRCPSCKKTVEKEALPTCIQWCKAAKQCLGEERWKKLMKTLGTEESSK